ncbi:Chitinase domain-containing protein 1 [Larimichthys crocea]|uniref:Uncharacterized protein n=1 Tax=Larimichthys crocea TaxID=215358 RepID=A0ACD3QDN8_LARCR|nr:Chitinase domain-containing protein 1 [Larimichthys crocea]
MRTTLFLLHAISCCWLVSATLSKTDAKKSHKAEAETSPAELSVLERGLVVSDPHWKDIVKEEKRHCAHIKRTFQGQVLGYVTPWNSHGYDIAKMFGPKLSSVSPVWLQLRRRGPETFDVTGLHDHDPGWVKAVRKSNKKIRMVPRLLFDGWSYQDYVSVLGSEDEIEELGSELVDVAKVIRCCCSALNPIRQCCFSNDSVALQTEGFDGFTLELWSQLGVRGSQGMFGREEFEQLAPVVDGFSLMTYDYSSGARPGPSSPLPWVRDCVLQLAPNTQWRQKILLGLNLYGLDFAGQGTEPILGGRYIELLREHRPKHLWDEYAGEHYFSYKRYWFNDT